MSSAPDSIPPDDFIPSAKVFLRLLWMAIQIILVLWVGQQGSQFFYQGF